MRNSLSYHYPLEIARSQIFIDKVEKQRSQPHIMNIAILEISITGTILSLNDPIAANNRLVLYGTTTVA
jgi:hypothetical protein